MNTQSVWGLRLLALARIVMGWFFFYAGITKVLNPNWTAAGYLNNAKSFPEFFKFLAEPGMIGIVNFANEWGLTLLGISLILGIGVRLSSVLGAFLMIMYYLALPFPKPNANAYIVDDHVIFALVLLAFAAMKAGRTWGLETWCATLPICRKFPGLHRWFG